MIYEGCVFYYYSAIKGKVYDFVRVSTLRSRLENPGPSVKHLLLKLTMYMTGIFYSIETRVPAPYNSVLAKANPIAFIIISVRKCIIYGSAPDSLLLLIWMTVGILISIVGINIIYKYENNYLKII